MPPTKVVAVIAVDTNILVYAHRRDAPWHESASRCLKALAEGLGAWAVPWPCLHEFLAIVTHPRIYDPPSTSAQAVDQVDAWMESPTLHVIHETTGHWVEIRELLRAGKIVGPRTHDARVAAICLTNGVRELLTADRDFSRFPDLNVRNPLIVR
jgi:uncharacterized protein